MRETMKQSLKSLQTEEFDIYYLHALDRSIPMEDILSVVDEFYRAGYFKRFGISNMAACDLHFISERESTD